MPMAQAPADNARVRAIRGPVSYSPPVTGYAPTPDGRWLAKNLSRNPAIPKGADAHVRASRRWFAGLLWRAFPAPSAAALAERAAGVLGVSERQVRNWLDERNDAGLSHITAVMLIAGCEVVFRQIEGRR